jgi:hypothetical protein
MQVETAGRIKMTSESNRDSNPPTLPRRFGGLGGLVGVILFLMVWLAVSGGMVAFVASELWVETQDILEMTATADAVVTGIQFLPGKPNSRPDVFYTYTIKGQKYSSRGFMPGWVANWPLFKRGSPYKHYVVGETIVIHYDPANPEQSCMVYGWSKGWLVGAMILLLFLVLPLAEHWGGPFLWSLGIALGVGAAALSLSALGKPILHPHDLVWYLLVFLAVCLGGFMYRSSKAWDARLIRRNRTEQHPSE